MTIIGICGKMGSGKDYIASEIVLPFITNVLNKWCLPLSFADQIKVNLLSKNSTVHFDDLYIQKTEQSRKMLQLEGTEYGRKIYGERIWLSYYDKWIKVFESRGIHHFMTTDVRFANEIDYIKSKGGIVIKVVSAKRNNQRLEQESKGNMDVMQQLEQHSSECGLDAVPDSKYDIIINNDDDNAQTYLEQLQRVLRNHL